MKTIKYLLSLFTMIGFLQAKGQSTVYVRSSATGANNGTSWANAYVSLKAAITNAPTGAQIWVAEGTYYPVSPSSRIAGNTIADKSLTIYGGFPNYGNPGIMNRQPSLHPTIISGDAGQNDDAWTDTTSSANSSRSDNLYNVFTITCNGTTSRSVTLDGLIIEGGNANAASAGSGRYGGGVYVGKSANGSSILSVNINNCTFRHNTAIYGAAIGSYYLYVSNGSVNYQVTRCRFYDNTADGWTVYGQVYAATNAGVNSTVTFKDNVAYHNHARAASGGAGLLAFTCTGNTTSSTVQYNAHFNTFADNYITAADGGVICAEGPGNTNGNSSLYISNNVFWNNSNRSNIYKRSASNTYFVQPLGIDLNLAAAADSFIVTGKNNIFADPQFQNNSPDYRLSPCSPGINSGALHLYTSPNSYITLTPSSQDVEGNIRSQGSSIDRGAYEYSGTATGASYESLSVAICPGSFYLFGGNNLGNAGTYYDTLSNANGCDSIITLNLSLKNSSSDTFSVKICTGDSFSFNNTLYGTAGFYTATFSNASGCDSIRTLHLELNPLPQPVIVASGSVLSVNGGPFDSYQWYLNGNVINGASSATHTPVSNGNYKVMVSKNNGSLSCSASSDNYAVGFVGLREANASTLFRFYPNPASLQVIVESNTEMDIQVLNLMGELMVQKKVQGKTTLGLQDLPKGIYLLRSSSGQVLGKLLLQ